MAIATGTAMAISAGVSALGSGASFLQAGKQRKRQQEAERAAGKAMAEAKAKLQTNFYEGLSIQKEPYELEREAALSGAAQIVQAGQAGERGVGEVAGRAAIYNQAQQAQTRTAMGKEMQALDKLVAAEDSRLRDARANIDLQEAQGQQQIAADARAARAAANQQGVQGLIDAGTSAMSAASLYGKQSPNTTNLLGFNTGDTFDPSNASFNKTQRVFNPSSTARILGAQLPSVSNITSTQAIDPSIFENILPAVGEINIPRPN